MKHITPVLLLLLLLASCKKDEGDTGTFDRKAMLKDVSEQIIAPSYAALKQSTDRLENAYTAFETAPAQASLDSLQSAFIAAYTVWQKCSAFEFGPAMDANLRMNVNVFPTSATKIENNITAGSYDLAAAANSDAKGFPALDYLLYAQDDASTLGSFQTTPARMGYLQAVIADISTKVTTVNSAWQNGYTTTFTDNDGTAAGSSISDLVNQMNYDWEIIKTAKLAIPLGKKSLGLIYPEKVEAYYSGISRQLVFANALAIRKIFLTDADSDQSYQSLSLYLRALGATHNGQPLEETILLQLDEAITRLGNLQDPLSDAIQNDPTPIDAAYIEVQKSVVLLKTDMPSALGVLITYQDNDGD